MKVCFAGRGWDCNTQLKIRPSLKQQALSSTSSSNARLSVGYDS